MSLDTKFDKSLEFLAVLSLGCKVNIVNNNNSEHHASLELKGSTRLIRLVKTAYYLYMMDSSSIKKNIGNKKSLRELLASTLKDKFNPAMIIMYRREKIFKQSCTYKPKEQTSTLKVFFAKNDNSNAMRSLMEKMKKDLKEKKSIGSLADTMNSENIKITVAILGAIFDDNTMAFDETLVSTPVNISNVYSSTDDESDLDSVFIIDDSDHDVPQLQALQTCSSSILSNNNTQAPVQEQASSSSNNVQEQASSSSNNHPDTINRPKRTFIKSSEPKSLLKYLYERTNVYWKITPSVVDTFNSSDMFSKAFERYCLELCKTCRHNNFEKVLLSKKQSMCNAFKSIYNSSCPQCKENIYTAAVFKHVTARLYTRTINLLLNKNYSNVTKRFKCFDEFPKHFIDSTEYKNYKQKLCSKSE